MLLKITEDPKELLFLWDPATNIYHIKNKTEMFEDYWSQSIGVSV